MTSQYARDNHNLYILTMNTAGNFYPLANVTSYRNCIHCHFPNYTPCGKNPSVKPHLSLALYQLARPFRDNRHASFIYRTKRESRE